MDELVVFIIALSLAMDAFAVSVTNGICVTHFGNGDAVRQGLYFGAFQFIMPIIGWYLGSSVQSYIEAVDHWIAFLLLGIIGGNMIRESLKREENPIDCPLCAVLTKKSLTLQAIATSIDALAVGISFAILDVDIVSAAAMIGIVAFVLSYIGGMAGSKLGDVFQKKTEILGGLLLIIIGAKIWAEHMFFV